MDKTRDFWKFVNKNRGNNNIPRELSDNGLITSNDLEAVNLLSSYFSSIYSTSKTLSVNFTQNSFNFDLSQNIRPISTQSHISKMFISLILTGIQFRQIKFEWKSNINFILVVQLQPLI